MSRLRGVRVELLVALLAVGFLAALTIVPASVLFATALATAGGLAGVAAVGSDPATTTSFANSLVQGGLSAGLAVAAGYPTGVFLGRYSWRGRAAVRTFLLVPFLLPSLVVVVGLVELFGPSGLLGASVPGVRALSTGLGGVVATNLLFNIPLVVLFTASGCEASSARIEESVATLGGSPWRAYLESWARPSATGAAAGGLLTFVFSALSFAPPLLLCPRGCATVEVRIWQLAGGTAPDPSAAGVLALLLLVAFVGPAVGYLALHRRLVASRDALSSPRRPVPWRSPVAWGLATVTGAVLAAELGLLGVVVVRSLAVPGSSRAGIGWSLLFAGGTADQLGISVGSTVENTVVFAVLASAVGLLVATASAFVGTARPRLAASLGVVTFVPILLSPVVLAFALLQFWGPTFGGAPNVWLLVVLSQALLGLPLALQSLEVPLATLPSAVRESTQSLGASRWGAFVDAELPRVRRGIETAALFSLALGLGEFTATYFLVTPQFTTLPVAVFALQTRRLYPASDAAAALLLLVSLVVYAALVVGAERDRR